MQRIINATPLIYLSKLGRLDLIKTLYPNLITTPQVKEEVLSPNTPEYNVLFDAFEKWIRIEDIKRHNTFEQILSIQNIHIGEASIIALAIEFNCPCLLFIDDRNARAVAKSFGFKVTGTLGIIIDAILNSLLTKSLALQLIDQLALNTPFRMSLELYKLVTDKIQEIHLE